MKVSPIAAGATPSVNPNEGQSASADRVARAKAILSGQAASEATQTDPQVAKAQNSLKRIKMKTKASPLEYIPEENPEVTPVVAALETAPETTLSDETAPIEQTETPSEATKPLSPQFAALAKQKRALQLKEKELLAREQTLTTQSTDKTSLEEYRARIKANALRVLQEEGVTYDQLTEQILSTSQDSPGVEALKAEIKTLNEKFENQSKSLTDRDTAQEEQVFNVMSKEANQLLAKSEDYPAISVMGCEADVMGLIRRAWKEQGEAIEVEEAIKLVEEAAKPKAIAKLAKAEKLKQFLTPQEKQQALQQEGGNKKTMRTLTNKDGVSMPSSARERAIAAFYGRK